MKDDASISATMTSNSQPSVTIAAQPANMKTDNLQVLKNLVGAVSILSADTNFKAASTILNEASHLQKEVESKDQEIVELTTKIADQETNKQIAFNEMYDVIKKERTKQADTEKRTSSLQATVQEKEHNLTEKEKAINELKNELQKRDKSYKDEKAKVTIANKDIDGLQQTLKGKDEMVEKLKTTNSNGKRALTTSEARVKELETSEASLKQQLDTSSARLSELQGFAAEYYMEEEDPLLDRFSSLWESAAEAMALHMKENLPAASLQNDLAWRDWKMPQNLRHQVPLPQTNSEDAKHMRLAVILAIIAREINNHIFQPVYILPEDSGIREVLVNLAMKDYKKESFCRSLLVSIDPDTQNRALDARIKQVVRNVGSYLFNLLSETQYSAVHQTLEVIVQKAADVWKLFQHSMEKYEPDFEPLEWGDSEYVPFSIAKNADDIQDRRPTEGDLDALVVFPRICKIKDDTRHPFTFVTVLRRSQCITAERELRRRDAPSPTAGRMGSARQRPRNRSISISNGPGNGSNQNRTFLDNGSPSVAQSSG